MIAREFRRERHLVRVRCFLVACEEWAVFDDDRVKFLNTVRLIRLHRFTWEFRKTVRNVRDGRVSFLGGIRARLEISRRGLFIIALHCVYAVWS